MEASEGILLFLAAAVGAWFVEEVIGIPIGFIVFMLILGMGVAYFENRPRK